MTRKWKLDQLVKIERSVGFVTLDSKILERAAAAMPTVVKTLNALHLASALALEELKEVPLSFAAQGVGARPGRSRRDTQARARRKLTSFPSDSSQRARNADRRLSRNPSVGTSSKIGSLRWQRSR